MYSVNSHSHSICHVNWSHRRHRKKWWKEDGERLFCNIGQILIVYCCRLGTTKVMRREVKLWLLPQQKIWHNALKDLFTATNAQNKPETRFLHQRSVTMMGGKIFIFAFNFNYCYVYYTLHRKFYPFLFGTKHCAK